MSKLRNPGDERWYDDACGTALALELVGERWSLLIVRELMFGGRRFSELRAGLPGISANILTQRLASLEASGVLRKRRLAQRTAVQVYALTRWGYESERAIQELGRWAVRSPLHNPMLPLSAASLMLSYRTMLDAGRAAGIDARVGFRIGADQFVAHVHDGAIDVVRAEADRAEATLTATPEALAAVTYGGWPIAEAEAAGALAVRGDRALAERFFTLFPLPAKWSDPDEGPAPVA